MKKEIQCPWCNKTIIPKIEVLKNEWGEISERRCSQCGGILAAYMKEDENILERVRTFSTIIG